MPKIRTVVVQIKSFLSNTADEFTKYSYGMKLKNSVNFVFAENIGNRIRMMQEKYGAKYPPLQCLCYF